MSSAEFVIDRPLVSDRRSPSRWVLSHVLRQAWLVPVVLIGAFGNAALAGVVPVLIGDAFDALESGLAAGRADLAPVVRMAWLLVISQTVRAFLQLGRNAGSELFGQRVERDVRSELYASLLGKSMTFHGRQPVGDTMARATNDVRELNLMFNPGLNLVIGSSFFLVVPIWFAFRYDARLAITPLVFTLAYAWALRRYLHELDPITREARASFGRMNARLAEAIDGIEVVKGAAQEPAEIARFHGNASAYREAFVQQGEREAKFLPLLLMGLAISAGFAHALAIYFEPGSTFTGGDVVGYVSLLSLFTFPTFISLFAYAQVSLGMASARRILELINRETELDENREGHEAAIRGDIAFEDVAFGYAPGAPVLRGITFRAEAGQTVAIVGQTGAGKTSLTRLINRTYDVDAGAVTIDGVDVRAWHLESLRRQIAVIEQEPFLFSRSIADNIAFGRPEAGRAEIEAVARQAQAHDFIVHQPDGYDTVIGERGVTLSGGQRQRLAIARALLTDPRILVLDDSTSAIDSATEDRIQRAMRKASQGRTTILITHRLSQIRWADLVVVLRGGTIEDCGTHDALMARSAPYRRLFARIAPGRAAGRRPGDVGPAEGDSAP